MDHSHEDIADEGSGLQEAFENRAVNKPNRVALFVGSDITSHIALNRLIPQMLENGFEPVVYLPVHKPSKKPEAQYPEVQNFAFYERGVTNKCIYPLIEQSETPLMTKDGKPIPGLNYSPKQLGALYDIEVTDVENVNDPDFIETKIKQDDRLAGAVSIRCYQIFKNDIIQAVQDKKWFGARKEKTIGGFFWNAHPGRLPAYQGVFTPLHVMARAKEKFAWSFHEIIYDSNDEHKGIDQGPLIGSDYFHKPIDYKKPVINLYLDFAVPVADQLMNNINTLSESGTVAKVSQKDAVNGEKPTYFSYPSREFFDDVWSQVHLTLQQKFEEGKFNPPSGFSNEAPPKLVDENEMLAFYVSSFGMKDIAAIESLSNIDDGTKMRLKKLHNKLVDVVDDCIKDWEKAKASTLIVSEADNNVVASGVQPKRDENNLHTRFNNDGGNDPVMKLTSGGPLTKVAGNDNGDISSESFVIFK